jgi:hypothetical protein
MQEFLISGLDSIASGARTLAMIAFVAANLLFVGGVILRRSSFVNRWTSPWLVANLAALALGAGVPMATGLMKMALGSAPDHPVAASANSK